MAELEFLAWVRSRLGKRRGRILVDSGDDAAVVRVKGGALLFKTDAVIDGVHFRGDRSTPEAVGHKAIARSLSDVAAMGCAPTFAVVALAVPSGCAESYLRRLFLGMNRTARRFGVAVVGGDLAVHAGKLAVTVSLLGESRDLRPIRRKGARPGDVILVTGDLGGSLRRKHLTFTPRVREALRLNRDFRIHAMIDISDGLSRDLAHLCEAGGVGADLESRRIPVSPAARRMRGDPLDHALYDGEDYELLFATAPGDAEKIVRRRLARPIGRIVRKRGVRLDGRPLEPRGWEHRW